MDEDRFINSKRWQIKRLNVLRRDQYLDQYILRKTGRMVTANTVHHLLPKEEFPQYAMCDWNLISLSQQTHLHVVHHFRTGKLTKIGKQLMMETAIKNEIKLKEKILVVGLPGTGKTTLVRSLLGEDAIAYDLDAIASAFRLTTEHTERHDGSRRLANNLFKAFSLRSTEFAARVFIIRTAPTLEDVSLVKPDRVIHCTRRYPVRRADENEIDAEFILKRIADLKKYCEKNEIEFEEYPPLKSRLNI